MPPSLHERASEILARVIDLPKQQALSRIEAECKGDEELKKAVLTLYNNIIEDNIPAEEISLTPDSPIKGGARTRIGQAGQQTKIVGSVTEFFFGNKKRRLVTLIVFLTLTVIIGFVVRDQYRHHVIEIERQEQKTMLNINNMALQQWIDLQFKKTSRIASDSMLVLIATYLDSLTNVDPTYEMLRGNPYSKKIFKKTNEIRKENNIEALSIINRRDPNYMILTEVAVNGADNAFDDMQLGLKGYEYYLKLQETQAPLFIPPIHDNERFRSLPKDLNVGTYCTFAVPIYKSDSTLIAFLFADFNVKNDFSSILNVSHHNATAETYAFNLEGHILSKSRFQDELQNTFLLDYDTTKESIYNIKLLDPGKSVYKTSEPKIPVIDQQYTRIFAMAIDELRSDDTDYIGSIMKPYRDYRGVKVIGAWTWLPEYDFGLIDEIDAAEALLALRYFDGIFFLFIAILLTLSILLYNSNVRIAKFGKRMEDFSKLGQYKLLSKLGEGGFGEVYMAEHNFLKTPVAIKLLKKEFIGTDMLDRFEKEVKVTSSLSHPNTVKVYDYGTSDSGQFYYVMEYLNGISLDKTINPTEPFPVARAIHVLLNCCYSLHEAHNKGLIHRDVKPMNIMLCNQGGAYDTIKLLDFGLVKKVDTAVSQQTQLNRIGGTPMFMAPERIRDPFNTDHRVDIYALGAVGIYMMSGQYLLEIISQKMLSGQETLQGNFKSQLIDREDVPEKLKMLLEDCVSFEPNKRPSSVRGMIQLLEELTKVHPWTREEALKWWKKYDVYL